MIVLDNRTDLPDRRLRGLIRAAAPHRLPTVELTVAEGGRTLPFTASAWPQALGRPFVQISVNPRWAYPWYHRNGAEQARRGYRSLGWIHTQEELLLLLIAHELRHIWQRDHDPTRWLAGHPETDADLWALARRAAWAA